MNNKILTIKKDQQQISLSFKQIGDDEMGQICSQKNIQNMLQFNLKHNRVTFEGIKHFATVKWDRLIGICLSSNMIGNKGCKYLSKAHVPNLRNLFLSSNRIEQVGLLHLSKGVWKKLTDLDLSVNKLNTLAMKSISRTNSPILEEIELWENWFTQASIKYLLLLQFTKVDSIALSKVFSTSKYLSDSQNKELNNILRQKYQFVKFYF